MNNRITVSVCMITYGQENYIREAIESVLMQECDFEIELIIANDCSPDQTDTIVQEILENHPKKGIVKYFKHEKNLGMMPNFVFALNKCLGTYIAICDGDDYWIDPLKLRKQVDFLKNNTNYDIVHSAVKLLKPSGETKDVYNTSDIINSFESLLDGNHIFSVTALFKNSIKNNKLPSWILEYPYGDWIVFLWTLRNQGYIGCINDVTAVYRQNIGVTSKIESSTLIRDRILLEISHDENFKGNSQSIVRIKNKRIREDLMLLNKKRKFVKAFFCFLLLLPTYPEKLTLIKLYLYSLKKKIK